MTERLQALDLLLLNRDYDGADEWVRQAAPDEVRLGRARLEAALGNLEPAIEALKGAKDPIELGELALLTARAEKEDASVTASLRELDSDAIAHFFLARIHLERGENEAALQSATRAIDLAHASGDRALLADLYAIVFDIAPSEKTIEHARRAVQLAWEEPLLPLLPRHVADLFLILKGSNRWDEADEVIADLRKRLRGRSKDEARRILGAVGVALTHADWYGTAASLLRRAVEGTKDEGTILLWRLHLAVAQFQDDPAEAMSNLTRVFLAAPSKSWLRSMALLVLAESHLDSGSRDAAGTLRRVTESFPRRLAPVMEVPLIELLFRSSLERGDVDEARTYGNAALVRALASRSLDLIRRGHLLRGKSHIAAGELVEANEDIHKAFVYGLRTKHIHDTSQAATILSRLCVAGDLTAEAWQFARLGCDMLEALQADFPRIDQRMRFHQHVRPLFDAALVLALHNALEARDRRWYREAFALIQRFQNRTLTDRACSRGRGRVKRSELVQERFVEERTRRSGRQKITEFKTRGRNFETVALPQVEPPTVDEILRALRTNEMLLTVVEAEDMCCLLPATNDGVDDPIVVPREQLDALVDELHEALHDAPEPAALDAIPQILGAISAELLLEDLLQRGQFAKLIVAPDGNLARIPFHALPAGGSSLSDFYPDGMICTPSAAYYASAATAAPKRCLAVAVGNDLPNLSRELAQLRTELGDVTVVEGSRATLSEVARLASGVDIFYYMGHGAIAEGDDVLQAKLLLADGVLSTYDLFSGRVQLARGATAILNCCDVGRTAAGTAGEMMGFVRGLFHAGASAAVTALWPLDDKIAATMMPSVVASLRRGAGLAAAMTRAIREVKSDPKYENPYYWAPYQWWGK